MAERFSASARPRNAELSAGTLRRRLRPINDALARLLGVRLVPARSVGVRINEEWVQRFRYFDRLVERVRDVDGTVVECGVAAGQSLAIFASLFRDRGDHRMVWGFDTFAGLPEPSAEDLADASVANAGMFGWASRSAVVGELRGHGFADEWIEGHVRLVKGLFDQTLPNYEGGEIALLHVDADLYESYRTVLAALWPHVAVGGVAAFDEYEDVEEWPGARRAVDEFLAGLAPGSAELVRDEEARKWFAVKRR